MTPFEEALRSARAERGWTQTDLAARLGTTPATVSRWECGRARPRWRRLRALAQVLDVPLGDFRPAMAGNSRNAEPRLASVASRIAQALEELFR